MAGIKGNFSNLRRCYASFLFAGNVRLHIKKIPSKGKILGSQKKTRREEGGRAQREGERRVGVCARVECAVHPFRQNPTNPPSVGARPRNEWSFVREEMNNVKQRME